jgi:Dullard-like phosphatase family protein
VCPSSNSSSLYIYKRPYVDFFLAECAQIFDIAVFTAAKDNYANNVVGVLNGSNSYIKAVYTRQSCTPCGIFHVKDLSILGTNLCRTVIVDDILASFAMHLDNGVLVEPWTGDEQDIVLLRLVPFLRELSRQKDFQAHLRRKTGISRFFK